MSVHTLARWARLTGRLPFMAPTPAAEPAVSQLPLLGLFRSGTNYTRTLLETHYQVRVDYDHFGWKHGLLPTQAGRAKSAPLRPLVVVKHPLATLASIFEYLHQHRRNLRSTAEDWPGFLRQRLVYFCEGQDWAPEYRFSNPFQLWNGVVWNHLRFAQACGGLTQRYEDLLQNPEPACARLAQHFGLLARSDVVGFQVPTRQTRRMADDSPRRRMGDYLDKPLFERAGHYLEGGFMARFGADDLALAHQELDPELLALLGYTLDGVGWLPQQTPVPGTQFSSALANSLALKV